MDFLASDDAVSDIDARLTLAGDGASAALLAELAWQLRQRDTRTALTLADRAESASARLGQADLERRRLMAPTALNRAEADRLDGRLDLAISRASQAVADSYSASR